VIEGYALALGINTFLTVLPVLNPPEGIPVFVTLTQGQPEEYTRRMARQTSIYVIAIMAVSFLAGRAVLAFFGVHVGHLQVAGGLIVAQTAWNMSTRSPEASPEDARSPRTQPDISFSPMALPLLSGPGVIALLIATSTHAGRLRDYIAVLMAVVALGIVTWISLRLSHRVSKRLGATGINVMTRVMGFIVLAIAVSFIAEGVAALAHSFGF
jgi:multiple antibiotic resistance protein